MTDAIKFVVRYDALYRRLTWTMHGFWTLADVSAFAQALRAAIAPLGPPPHRFDSLSDARKFPVQSREVSEALGAIDRASATLHSGRVAIVVGSVLNKLQVERSLSGNVHTFTTLEDAEAWLALPPSQLIAVT